MSETQRVPEASSDNRLQSIQLDVSQCTQLFWRFFDRSRRSLIREKTSFVGSVVGREMELAKISILRGMSYDSVG